MGPHCDNCLRVPWNTFFQIYYRSLHDLHHSVLGICMFHYFIIIIIAICYTQTHAPVCFSVGEANALTTFITNALKAAVGRYRPKYLAVIANPGSSQSTIDDARMSFPSGHSSSIYTSMVFLSLYLAGKIGVFRKHNHPGFVKVFIAFLPITIAVTVSVSRLTDYSHNVDDVIAGALIGTACAALTYFTNYGSLFDKRSHLPRNRHRVLSKEEQASASNRLPSPVLPQWSTWRHKYCAPVVLLCFSRTVVVQTLAHPCWRPRDQWHTADCVDWFHQSEINSLRGATWNP